jgi:membrane-associated phospholipid phosphatase
MQPVTDARARWILMGTVLIAHLLMFAALLLGKVSLDPRTTAFAYAYIGIVALLLVYVRLRRMRPLYFFFDAVVATFLVTIPVIVWTYVAIGFAMPLADPQLIAMDAALGFDWHAFIAFVDRHAWLANTLALAYSSFSFQLLLLPAYFALRGKGARASAIIFGYTLLCLVSSIVSIWYPALGTYAAYAMAQDDLVNINAKFGFFFLEQFNAVRQQTHFILDFNHVAGVLTFPSVHAAVAGLCAWAAWDSRLLRYPVLLLNIGMAIAAVSHGAHYLTDIVAGLGMTGLTVSVATALFYRPPPAARSLVVEALRRVLGRPGVSGSASAGLPGHRSSLQHQIAESAAPECRASPRPRVEAHG